MRSFAAALPLVILGLAAPAFAQAALTPASAKDVAALRAAAERGDADAQSKLGLRYLTGEGVAKDEAQAVKWLRKSANQGFAEAQYDLGLAYAQGRGVDRDDAQAVAWYRKAAEQGYGRAQINLGSMYRNGRGVAKDETQAVMWWRKAAEQGIPRAWINLGHMYEDGSGVPQDYAQALAWYRKAADQGMAEAQSDVARMYEDGRGIAKDQAQAVACYRLAANQGNTDAKAALDRLRGQAGQDLPTLGPSTPPVCTRASPAVENYYTPPEWLRKPTFDQLMADYPTAAMSRGVSGQAVIKCTVQTDGLLRSCSVLWEDQPGMGFGPAAVVLSRTFLMKPATKGGQPIESEITFPINFETGGPALGAAISSTTVLGSTIWAKTPTVSDILAEIDKKVGDKFADGEVALQCDLAKSTGRLSNCIVANASPGMAQFTGVAKSLVPKFQADPEALADIKGSARINIAFGFPDMASPAWSQRYLTHPHWTQTISPDPNQPLFPAEAAKAGLKTGSATVECIVVADGSLSQCKATGESTPGVGFGVIAEQIASVFKLNPWTDEGLPADGAHVRIPIRMVYDEKAAGAPPPSPNVEGIAKSSG